MNKLSKKMNKSAFIFKWIVGSIEKFENYVSCYGWEIAPMRVYASKRKIKVSIGKIGVKLPLH